MRLEDNNRIRETLEYMERHYTDRPSLAELAARVNLSKFHFQRLFTRWAGISPHRFLQCLSLDHAKQLLERRTSVLDAALDSGLSGPGRLHDLFVTHEAVTPGEFKEKGQAMLISYGFHPTPFGDCGIAITSRGICWLSFIGEIGGNGAGNDGVEAGREAMLEELRGRWEHAILQPNQETTAGAVAELFAPAGTSREKPFHLLLRGTNFQVKVWEALLRIPLGHVASYQDVARYMGNPGAARAIGSAVGRNPIACLIPCHRVIRQMGSLGGYRWGTARKRLLLAWEHGATAGEELSPSGQGAGSAASGMPGSPTYRVPEGNEAIHGSYRAGAAVRPGADVG